MKSSMDIDFGDDPREQQKLEVLDLFHRHGQTSRAEWDYFQLFIEWGPKIMTTDSWVPYPTHEHNVLISLQDDDETLVIKERLLNGTVVWEETLINPYGAELCALLLENCSFFNR